MCALVCLPDDAVGVTISVYPEQYSWLQVDFELSSCGHCWWLLMKFEYHMSELVLNNLQRPTSTVYYCQFGWNKKSYTLLVYIDILFNLIYYFHSAKCLQYVTDCCRTAVKMTLSKLFHLFFLNMSDVPGNPSTWTQRCAPGFQFGIWNRTKNIGV